MGFGWVSQMFMKWRSARGRELGLARTRNGGGSRACEGRMRGRLGDGEFLGFEVRMEYW